MAQEGTNNRRPLPRVGNSQRELQKGIYEANKNIQKNSDSDLTANKRNINENKQQIDQVKNRLTKVESDVRKNTQAAEKAQQTANMADNNAINAQRASVQNKKDIEKVQKSTREAIQNAVSNLNNSFFGRNNNLGVSVNNLQSSLNSSVLNFNSSSQDTQQRFLNIETALSTTNQQLQVIKADFGKSIQILTADNMQEKASILQLTQNVEDLKQNELDEERAREKKLRIDAADKRREIKENILEGAGKALKKTGQGLANTTNSLLGGFNLLDALKATLGGLLLGVTIAKFPDIIKNIEENIDKWKRVAALFAKNVLNPVKRFFGAIIDLGFKVIGWTFKGLNLVRKVFGKIISFGYNLGKKVVNTVFKFFSALFNAGRRGTSEVVEQGAKAGTKAASRAAGEATQNRGFWGTASNLFERGKNALIEGGQFVDNKLLGGAIGRTATNTKQYLLDQFENLIKPLSDKFKPITNLLSTIKNGAKTAIKKGPEAFKEFFNTNLGKITSLLKPAVDASEPIISKLAPIMGALTNFFPGAKQIGKALKGAAGGASLLNFPIDFLVNRLILGHDSGEAMTRAAGSTLGSAVGNALGILAGGVTGPLAPAASSFLGATGGIFGGEFGDWMTTRLFYPDSKDTTFDAIAGVFPFFNQWLNGNVTSEESSDKSSNGGLGKIEIPTTTPTSRAVTPSGSGMSMNTSFSAPPNPSLGTSPSLEMTRNTTANQMFRKPKRSSASGSSNTSTNAPSIANITMPAQTVSMPTEVIGDKSNEVNQNDAQPIPSIPSSNPMTDYLQIAAAETFEMQLV